MKLTSSSTASALLCSLSLMIAPACAGDLTIEPGRWQVTSRTVLNGAATPPTVKPRCLTPEQAGDVIKTFGPAIGTVNSTCKPAEYETQGRKLKWRLECRGQLDMDILGDFDFDTPTHYTATVSSKGWMAGSLMSDVKTELEAERVGECQQ
jgi:hypothetical protein